MHHLDICCIECHMPDKVMCFSSWCNDLLSYLSLNITLLQTCIILVYQGSLSWIHVRFVFGNELSCDCRLSASPLPFNFCPSNMHSVVANITQAIPRLSRQPGAHGVVAVSVGKQDHTSKCTGWVCVTVGQKEEERSLVKSFRWQQPPLTQETLTQKGGVLFRESLGLKYDITEACLCCCFHDDSS